MMHARSRAASWLWAFACSATCSTSWAQAVLPFTTTPPSSALVEEEPRIWGEAAEADKVIRKSGFLLADPAINAYLQSVMDRLYPEFKDAMRVRAVNDPQLNAFAMPNGSIYVHMGLLARVQSESQLAAVLAHEGAHFVHRHGYQQRSSVKSASAFAGAMIFLGGVGLLAGMAAASSVAGFSRDHEREADRVGFARMIAAGYDAGQAVRVFQILADEARALERKDPYFFASHPRMEERIESYRELLKAHSGPPAAAMDAEAAFAERMRPLRAHWLERGIAAGGYKSMIHALTQEGAAAHFGSHIGYYLGEAYNRRGNDGDTGRADQAYRQAIDSQPDFVASYRGLGITLMKAGDRTGARAMLQRYLEKAPGAADQAYVKQYLEQLEKQP
jgi:predicted Zn-dependent protease